MNETEIHSKDYNEIQEILNWMIPQEREKMESKPSTSEAYRNSRTRVVVASKIQKQKNNGELNDSVISQIQKSTLDALRDDPTRRVGTDPIGLPAGHFRVTLPSYDFRIEDVRKAFGLSDQITPAQDPSSKMDTFKLGTIEDDDNHEVEIHTLATKNSNAAKLNMPAFTILLIPVDKS